jgi:hypothetical protein
MHPNIRIMITCLLLIQIPILIAGNYKNFTGRSDNNWMNIKLLSKNTTLEIYETMHLEKEGLSRDAFEKAWQGFQKLSNKNALVRNDIITIADFSKPSSAERLFVIDIKEQKILYKSLVAHGKNSGELYAKSFSNIPETYKSSLGFYLTLNSYFGENGFSLRLKGLEKNINDKAYERAIVMHGAPYVSKKNIQKNGLIGRSFGCPAIPENNARPIIQSIKNGSLFFIYHPNKLYAKQSPVLKNHS